MIRRRFFAVIAGFVAMARALRAASKTSPYAAQFARVDPAQSDFECEKRAAVIEAAHERLLATGTLPATAHCAWYSPLATKYEAIAPGVFEARFGASGPGFGSWIASLGKVSRARFFALPGDLVRYEVSSRDDHGLAYRVGLWKQTWEGAAMTSFHPVSETLTRAADPWFQDVTSHCLGAVDSFQKQLLPGNPYWRARLDVATGIDLYGNNGIAVADIDGDGRDEVFVCQPGGLPNRLYNVTPTGQFEDITERAGLSILDETTCALFVDFRNLGRQDLVVLRGSGPLLFLNDGHGRFAISENAFRFATPPQGSFTGMAAADYDRDGRVDIYLCCYVYFQSEDQYRYPAPYHDARNGPPNFLFRNRLDEGFFEDVTAASGVNQNNDRYSFAPAWCDFDGSGWPSLYVANDFGRNNLYRNRNGHFTDEAAALGVEDMGPGMSASWFDYDGDGKPDLYVSNMWSAPGQRVSRDPAFGARQKLPREPYQRHAKGNSLYRNTGGVFEETGAQQDVEMGRWAWSSGGFDFDNDGVPEIYTACGMLTNEGPRDLRSFFWREVVAQSPPDLAASAQYENGWNAINQMIRETDSWCGHDPNVFFAKPAGASKYYDFSGVSGLDFADDSRAFAAVDFDGDGNLDLILKSRLGPQVRVLRNSVGRRRTSIAIQLTGTKSNRDAIGARVEAGGQVKFVNAGSGYLSQHTKTVHFGLGAQTDAKVRVVWPSGFVQEFGALAAGHKYHLVEGDSHVVSTTFETRAEWAASPVTGNNSAGAAPAWLIEPVPLPVPHKGPGVLTLTDAEQAAPFSIFKRYLFDLRKDIELPAALLIDGDGRARKFYPRPPAADEIAADLKRIDDPQNALPFPGAYYQKPKRNYYKLGAAFYQEGYPDQALPYLYETVRRAPNNTKAWMAIGQLMAAADRHSDAVMAFEKVLELEPKRPFALLYAGESHAKLGHDQQAEALFRRALDADPANADAANQLGLVLAQRGDNDGARRYFEKAIGLQRDHNNAINNLGVLYMKTGHTVDAVAALQYGLEVAPDDDTLYLNLVRAYLSTGDRERAHATLQRWVEHKPDSAKARAALEELESR